MQTVEHHFELDAPLARVWAFHNDPHNLPRIMPMPLRVVRADVALQQGSTLVLRIAGLIGWTLRVAEHSAPDRFVDEQVQGPWRHWRHVHTFAATADGRRSVVHDRITFSLGWGPLDALVAATMPLTFGWRERRTRRLVARQ
jgi:ligand-binding SRPBCC domain-containing protein